MSTLDAAWVEMKDRRRERASGGLTGYAVSPRVRDAETSSLGVSIQGIKSSTLKRKEVIQYA
jgi:hypothetical protein